MEEDSSTNRKEGESANSAGKRKWKEVAIFGNYRNYYGYRIGQGLEEDPRLKAMKKEWFQGKKCLDIGCNSGVVTIAIAQTFSCQSILGIDIDSARIEDANWTLRKVMRMNSDKVPPKKTKSANAEKVTSSDNNRDEPLSPLNKGNASQGSSLNDVVSFEKGNFVENWHSPKGVLYDTILCLSVTKWVQLNWGDDGIITLFSRVWRLLQPNGVFIVEPQPWTSYYKNRLVSEAARNNYLNIKILPEDFQDILLDKIGFREVYDITSSISCYRPGFDRPILAFKK